MRIPSPTVLLATRASVVRRDAPSELTMDLMEGPCNTNYVSTFAGPQAATYVAATSNEALLSDVNATFALCGAELNSSYKAHNPLPMAPENAGLLRTKRVVSQLGHDYTTLLVGPPDGNRANFTSCLRGAVLGSIQGRLDADKAAYQRRLQDGNPGGLFIIGFFVVAFVGVAVVAAAAGSK